MGSMSSEETSLHDFGPGRIVAGRYEVVRPTRHNGLSASFEARDASDGSRADLTVFPASLFEGREQAVAFARTWDAWKRVESPILARVRSTSLLGSAAVLLVTDPPGGESLRERLARERRLPQAEVLDLGREILRGLNDLHAHGLVHGDIKPGTILLRTGPNGTLPCLVDGGITGGLWSAKHLGDRTALIGTPFYAPVEQFGGDPPDVQSDLYNLAAVLFECAAGVLPWPGKHFLEVFQAKLDKHPVRMRARAPDVDVDPVFDQAIAAGLLADRSKRYATAQAFLDALEGVAVRGPHA